MTTNVGMQTNFIDALKELIELDYDAIGAYEAAIERLENVIYKNKLREFKEDHEKHVTDLTNFLEKMGEKAPRGADNTKSLLAKGKVIMGSLLGDKNILGAMLSNEDDTNSAYERMNKRADELPNPEIHKIIAKGLEDERKHKLWLENIEK